MSGDRAVLILLLIIAVVVLVLYLFMRRRRPEERIYTIIHRRYVTVPNTEILVPVPVYVPLGGYWVHPTYGPLYAVNITIKIEYTEEAMSEEEASLEMLAAQEAINQNQVVSILDEIEGRPSDKRIVSSEAKVPSSLSRMSRVMKKLEPIPTPALVPGVSNMVEVVDSPRFSDPTPIISPGEGLLKSARSYNIAPQVGLRKRVRFR